jgi:multiple sugar transport system substrate-binding protein
MSSTDLPITPGKPRSPLRGRAVAVGVVAMVFGVAACSSSKHVAAATSSSQSTAPSASASSSAPAAAVGSSASAPAASSAAPVASSAAAGTGSGPTKLIFWEFDNGPDTPSMTSIINNFNKSQSKYQIVDVNINYQTLAQKILVTMAAGGSGGPSIFTTSTDTISQYVANGSVANLDDFYSTPSLYPDASTILPAAVTASHVSGHAYAIPENFFDEGLCYNKDLFAKAGITSPPATWADFATDASKLTIVKNGRAVQYAIALGDQNDTSQFWQPLLWNGGGGVVSDDGKTSLLGDPKTISALQFWVNGVKNLHWSPIGDQGPAAQALFDTGRAASYPCGPWVVGTAQAGHINLGVAPMPAGTAGNFPWAGSIVFAVPSTDTPAQKAGAEAFGDFWNTKASQFIFSNGNGYPTTRTDMTPADFPNNPWVGAFSVFASTSKYYLSGVPAGTQINNEIFVPALDKALAGQGTVQDLFTSAGKAAQTLLDKNP